MIFRKIFNILAKSINKITCRFNNKKYYEISNSTVLRDGFSIRLDSPREKKKYLKIGNNCIIDAHFVFESYSGCVNIGNNCYLGSSMYISHSYIYIGNNVTIAWGCTIYDHDSHSLNYLMRRKDVIDELNDIKHRNMFIKNKDWTCVKSEPIIIEDDVWIGMNCLILKGVKIGKGSVVGAGSVVTKNVPEFVVVAGNPATIVKYIK